MEKPEVKIFCFQNKSNLVNKKEVAAGIEEEGVFYSIEDVDEDGQGSMEDVIKLAHKAANASLLGVGIGMNNKYAALTCRNFSEYKAIFAEENFTCKKLRNLGINAGRYVKGKPFNL